MTAFVDPPAQARSSPPSERIPSLSRDLRREFGTPFRFYDGWSGEPIRRPWPSGWTAAVAPEPAGVIRAIAAGGRPRVDPSSPARYRVALPFRGNEGPPFVAIGHLDALARSGRQERTELARLRKWALAAQLRISEPGRPGRDEWGTTPAGDGARPSLLGPTRCRGGGPGGSGDSPDRILRRAATVLPAEALIWVPGPEDEPVVALGRRDLAAPDRPRLGRFLSGRRVGGGWACIVNQACESPIRDCFPGAESLMALSSGGSGPPGWLIAINKRGPGEHGGLRLHGGGATAWPASAPFQRSDVDLLMPFASLLDLRSGADRRGAWARELSLGMTRSLTAAIDAKDSYTYGHSERVARIAVELGRALGLRGEALDDLYLGGLLHDIGKIGVRDAVLMKSGPLTPEEFAEIREHVLIGGRILADCRAAAHLLPMVLYHHERFDGGGYPHGLRGEAIPRAARIMAVADSYDAMRTSRVYRSALHPRQIEEILERGRGGQWDGRVIDAYSRARRRIAAIYDQAAEDAACIPFADAARASRRGGREMPAPGPADEPGRPIGRGGYDRSLATT